MQNILNNFGEFCFTEEKLRSYLSEKDFQEFKKVQKGKIELSKDLADSVANAVKIWAMENGATHFTHWFQPLTELTAEKHESFISVLPNGDFVSEFSGKDLIKGEADTSSFPNGGVRSTFEARGYTAWDPKSPMFLRGENDCKTLYIPTAFIGYNQMALDKKVPLLRSIDFITEQVTELEKILNPNLKDIWVENNLGIEQEYFLIDKKYYENRSDLMLSGRTIFGSLPPKNQELNDHYYGSIKERVEAVMSDIDKELWKIGIMAKTRHNEVAPNQFEIALMYSSANVAIDQNQLTMDIIKKVANRHNLSALLHEKPFKGINGSGKHCNWSISINNERNLFDPSSLTENNLSFLLYFIAVIEAVDRYSDILRASCATPGNDHRLGGHEAPPAIISIFIGEEIENLLKNVRELKKPSKENMQFGVKNFTKISKDISDRNRTSPFAFTGNKFEFRMPGSSASASTPIFIINTIVGTILKEYINELKDIEYSEINEKIISIVEDRYFKHKRIIFNGNGYTDEWKIEAKKRGLTEIKNTVEGLKVYKSDKIISLFNNASVLSPEELNARYQVYCERYEKQINIECLAMIRAIRNKIYPSIMRHSDKISKSILSISQVIGNCELLESDKAHLLKLLCYKQKMKEFLNSLENENKTLKNIDDSYERILYIDKTIIPIFNHLREIIDNIETQIETRDWAFPTYEEMLFKL